MDEKRRISLERADELYEEIEDYLNFKDEFLRETAERRDVLSKKHKEELMNYFEASEDDWNDWHWQLRHRISSVSLLSKFIKLSDKQYKMFEDISNKFRWATTPYYLSLMDFEDMR